MQPTAISFDDLFAMIGQLYVENVMMRKQFLSRDKEGDKKEANGSISSGSHISEANMGRVSSTSEPLSVRQGDAM